MIKRKIEISYNKLRKLIHLKSIKDNYWEMNKWLRDNWILVSDLTTIRKTGKIWEIILEKFIKAWVLRDIKEIEI